MEWTKIKKYLIFIFLFINAFLFSLNYLRDTREYTLSLKDTELLEQILSDNNIPIYTTYPQKFYPMAQITMKEIKFDKNDRDDIVKQVFTGGTNSKQTYTNNENEASKITYTNNENTEQLIFEGNQLFYNNTKGKFNINDAQGNNLREKAIALAEMYANILIDEKYDIALLSTDINEEDEIKVTFCEEYKGYKIFSNTIDIIVNESKGIVEAKVIRYTPIGYKRDKRNIYAVDEVLYNVLYYIKKNQSVTNYAIADTISKGYYNIINEYESTINPCYRIPLVNLNTGKTLIIYVDAFTNEIIQ